MRKYNLYLDESQPSQKLPYFCLAGCIISEGEEYTDLTNKINKLKADILHTNKCMHEYEIREKSGEYSALRDNKANRDFWDGLKNVFLQSNMLTICSAIDCREYKKIYSYCEANDSYHVTLQIIMENFAYYLSQNDATGMIYLEKTNDNEAGKLRNQYHHIISTGTLYLSSNELQRRLININFLTKDDNNTGLQLADFLPNAVNRQLSGLPQKQPSVLDAIEAKLYDGGIGEHKRFGKRVLLGNNP